MSPESTRQWEAQRERWVRASRWLAVMSAAAFALATASFFVVLPGGQQSMMASLGDCGVFPFCLAPGYAWVFSLVYLFWAAPVRRRVWLWAALPPAAWVVTFVAAVLFDWWFGPFP